MTSMMLPVWRVLILWLVEYLLYIYLTLSSDIPVGPYNMMT